MQFLIARDIKISFVGEGSSTVIDSIIVENLTQGTTLNLGGTDTLHLISASTSSSQNFNNFDNYFRNYPNPANESSNIEFIANTSGIAIIELFDLTGKSLYKTQNMLLAGKHIYKVDGLSSGFYVLKVNAPSYIFSGKIVSIGLSNQPVTIYYQGGILSSKTENELKSVPFENTMQYEIGDRLKFTGVSGIYSTIITDMPTESKTIIYNFIPCTDVDGNNYSVVQIGKQIWMAENLKTTMYNDQEPIPNAIDNTEWEKLTTGAYCNYDNLENNTAFYGRLYNWYAVSTGKLAPAGWHVPTNDDWIILENYLIDNGFNYDGTKDVDKVAKSLCSTTGWNLTRLAGTPGAEPKNNNSTGFSALPGGFRITNGEFLTNGEYGKWWSSTKYKWNYSYLGSLYYSIVDFDRYADFMNSGFSIRLIRDN